MEAANLTEITPLQLVQLYDAEVHQMRRWLGLYISEPSSRTYKFFSYHRDFANELIDELDRRIQADPQSLSIADALDLFNVPYTTADGQTFVTL